MKPRTSVKTFIDTAPRTVKAPKVRRNSVLSLRLSDEVKARLSQLADEDGILLSRFVERYLDFMVEVSLDKAREFAATTRKVQEAYEKTAAEATEWSHRLERAVALVQQQRSAYNELQDQYIGLKASTLATNMVKRATANRN